MPHVCPKFEWKRSVIFPKDPGRLRIPEPYYYHYLCSFIPNSCNWIGPDLHEQAVTGLLTQGPVTVSFTHSWKSVWNVICFKKWYIQMEDITRISVIWLFQLLLLCNISHPKLSGVTPTIYHGEYSGHNLLLLLDVWGQAGVTQRWAVGIWSL